METASGFVLFRRGCPFRYLTLRNARHGDVGLPKGHVEPGEGLLEAAIRETAEETGIADAAPNRWFKRTIRYRLGGTKAKEVTYFAAEAASEGVRLSREHDEARWRDLDHAVTAIRHEDLRAVLRDAAVFLKDPFLRRGLTPEAARRMLVGRVGDGAPVLAHTAEVAAMARIIGGGTGDPDYVEAAAWLHDIGRAVTQGDGHPLEGFRIVAAGHGGYAPPCLSHYTKGAPDPAMPHYREMCEACDLETFDPAEQVIALADALAAGPRRVTLEERFEDLARRYGPSPFFEKNLAISRRLKAEFEARTGKSLYAVLGISP